jgi:hypothetical protein
MGSIGIWFIWHIFSIIIKKLCGEGTGGSNPQGCLGRGGFDRNNKSETN